MKPNGGIKGFGQVVTFDIPSYGILDRVFVRFVIKNAITSAGAAVDEKKDGLTTVGNQIAGIQLVDYIEIASQNKGGFSYLYYRYRTNNSLNKKT